MGKGRQAGELSYFAAALSAYLRDKHPQMTGDEAFIRERSDAALDAYIEAIQAGADRLAAQEQANAVLYRDLRFSKYDALWDVVAEWFPEVEPGFRTAFCLGALPLCAEVFEGYELADDFEMQGEYNDLVAELTGWVQTFIGKNGLKWLTTNGSI